MNAMTLAQQVLAVLCERGGIVSHADLLHEVWGPGYDDDAATRRLVCVTVSRLRRSLVGTGEHVVTYQGRGYGLTVVEAPGDGDYPRTLRHHTPRRSRANPLRPSPLPQWRKARSGVLA